MSYGDACFIFLAHNFSVLCGNVSFFFLSLSPFRPLFFARGAHYAALIVFTRKLVAKIFSIFHFYAFNLNCAFSFANAVVLRFNAGSGGRLYITRYRSSLN